MRNILCRFTWTAPFTLRLPFLALAGFFFTASPANAATYSGSSSGWGASTVSAASGVIYQVAKQIVSPGAPYSPLSLTRRASSSIAGMAGSVLSKCKGNPGLCLFLAGAAGYVWYVETHDGVTALYKPAASGGTPDYNGGPGYCYQRYHGSFCVNDAAATSAASYVDAQCRSNTMCEWAAYGQTVTGGGCNMQGSSLSIVSCSYTFTQPGSAGTSSWSFNISGSHVNSGTATNSSHVPVPDSEITGAWTATANGQPTTAQDFAQNQGIWNPDVAVLADIPEVRGEPARLTKVEPQADGTTKTTVTTQTPVTTATCTNGSCSVTNHMETINNVTITNASGQVINNTTSSADTPQGHYNVDASQAPSVDIPTDYAREVTMQAIRDALVNREAQAGDAACQITPSCSGDAISCAMLLEEYRSRCAYKAEQIPPDVPVPPVQTDLNAIVGNLDSSRWSGSAVCPPDLHATVAGYQITVPMDQPCAQAAFVRPAVIAAALLMAGMIIMRVE